MIERFMEAVRDRVDTELREVEHLTVYPDETRMAEYRDAKEFIIMGVAGLELLPNDPRYATGQLWPCRLTFTLTVSRTLLGSTRTKQQSTYIRLWLIAGHLAAKLSKAHLLPGVQRGVCEVVSVLGPTGSAQAGESIPFDISITFTAEIHLDSAETLELLQDGRITVVHDDSQYPVITAIDMEYEGQTIEVSPEA